MEKYGYKFSFGPWNINEGADSFGPNVRPSLSFDEKIKVYKELEFDQVQFHDDDAVPNLDNLSPAQIRKSAQEMRQKLADNGLTVELIGPRLWENPLLIDGAFTSNNPKARTYAIDRLKKATDVALELGSDIVAFWFAREGTYLREAKDVVKATHQLVDALNQVLEYAPKIRLAIEPKPNEPMDMGFIPTMGHAIALGSQTVDPTRVGTLMESAHSLLAGLDPSDEIGFALTFNKLFSVHLNDQNGLKFDEDRTFGAINLRGAFNQVRVLDENEYWKKGTIGLDIKAIRTQPADLATKHLRNSMWIFLRLLEVTRSIDRGKVEALRAACDYEELDYLIISHLLNK